MTMRISCIGRRLSARLPDIGKVIYLSPAERAGESFTSTIKKWRSRCLTGTPFANLSGASLSPMCHGQSSRKTSQSERQGLRAVRVGRQRPVVISLHENDHDRETMPARQRRMCTTTQKACPRQLGRRLLAVSPQVPLFPFLPRRCHRLFRRTARSTDG